jgi:hypothetical protein
VLEIQMLRPQLSPIQSEAEMQRATGLWSSPPRPLSYGGRFLVPIPSLTNPLTKTAGSVCFPTCYPLTAELIMARGEIQGHVLVLETWGTKTESEFYVARAIHSRTDSGQKDKRNQKDDVNVLQCVSWARFTSSKNKNRSAARSTHRAQTVRPML